MRITKAQRASSKVRTVVGYRKNNMKVTLGMPIITVLRGYENSTWGISLCKRSIYRTSMCLYSATSQIMDPFKSSLEEWKDTYHAGRWPKEFSLQKRKLHSSEQYHCWMWKARFSSLYLPRDWQSLWQTTTMSTHLYKREEFQTFLAVSSIQVHFPNLSERRGSAMAAWLWFGWM